jgi:hypothetical protein
MFNKKLMNQATCKEIESLLINQIVENSIIKLNFDKNEDNWKDFKEWHG